ncbi:hypothetical protein A2U01_0053454, partial [Trifolium medium]|nr:hypothetical protein [Trifolium medium]
MASNSSFSSKGKSHIIENLDEERAIQALWQSQVLIPFSTGPNSHAFLGYFTFKKNMKDVEPFFPRHPAHPLLAFDTLIDTSFLSTVAQQSRAMPTKSGTIRPTYCKWLERLKPKK